MKWAIFICLLIGQLNALSPPKPIKGTAMTVPSSQISKFNIAGLCFELSLPKGWGLSTSYLNTDGSRCAMLFPGKNGFGCMVTIHTFDQDQDLQKKMSVIKKSFKKVQLGSDQFEHMTKNTRYCCKKRGLNLIEVWYSLPRNKAINKKLWASLKNCITLCEEEEKEGIIVEEEKPSEAVLKKIPDKGWVYNHPDNESHVIFETDEILFVSKNTDSNRSHLLEITDMDTSGFYYVEWDQQNLDTINPYKAHLKKMYQEIVSFDTKQKFEKNPEYSLEDKCGFWRGHPYSIITLSGDGFVYGFALKNKFRFSSANISDYIKRVKWWKDN